MTEYITIIFYNSNILNIDVKLDLNEELQIVIPNPNFVIFITSTTVLIIRLTNTQT